MTSKEYLSQTFVLHKQIKSKEMQIQKLHDMQYNISSILSPDKVQTTPSFDRMGDITANLNDLLDEYAKDVTKLLKLKYDIKKIIEKIDNPKYKLILEERYINLKRWEDIAADNNYSWNHVHRLHNQALKEVIECYYLDMV